MVKIGFTGTQEGMTISQKKSFLSVWQMIEDELGPIREFPHGDCIGAADEADDFAITMFTRAGIATVVIHPPDVDTKRAWCVGDITDKPLPSLVLSTAIVQACAFLIDTTQRQAAL